MDPNFNLAPPPPSPPQQQQSPSQYLPFMMHPPPPQQQQQQQQQQQPPSPPPSTVSVAPNLQPPVQAQNPNHPSYTEMIYAAITALREQDGSSKRAIAKYIEGVFTDLPSSHSSLLTHHLKRLKDNGSLLMVKKSYKLPRSDFPDNNINNININNLAVVAQAVAASPTTTSLAVTTGPKKGRGRPPKPKPNGPVFVNSNAISQPINNNINNNVDLPVNVPVVNSKANMNAIAQPMSAPTPASATSTVVKRGRGRPPMNGGASVLGKRGRGRPSLSGVKKSPGRPKKLKSISSPNGLKRGRGRPPKLEVAAATVQAPPVPVAQVQQATAPAQPQINAVSVPGAPVVPKTRGRPRKTTASPAAGIGGISVGNLAAVNVAAVVSEKRRGRPPRKFAAVLIPQKPKRNYYVKRGRSVGRPRKYASGTASTPDGERAADLKRKLEFFQSKVMQAVGALKPQFTSETNIGAIAAIQDLEGLAAMDITAPFRDEPQPQQPSGFQSQPQGPTVVQNHPPPPPLLPQLPAQQPQPQSVFQSHLSYPPPPGY
ncbi:hypothetical protein ACFE04_010676 [Oxalis oulophora]